MAFPLSVLDQSPISAGSVGGDALRNSIDLARLTEALGYERYWIAEHHGTPMLASAAPEILIAAVAAATSTMKIGSGGVMLPHYSPLKVAEVFSMLAALHPGRIDLGLGRAPGSDPQTMFALQRDRRQGSPDDFPEQLAELLAYLEDDFPDRHPFARLAALPGGPERPEVWLLGSSPQSAIWAGELGLPYVFADFINPAGAEIAALYRERFVPSRRRAEPYVGVALSVVCAESDAEAQRLATSARMAMTLLRQGRLLPVPPVETAVAFFEQHEAPSGRRAVVGSPDTVRPGIEEVVAAYEADEAMLVTITYSHEARRRSYELVAEAFPRMNEHVPAAELAARRERLYEQLERSGIDALFLAPSSDLEYLTGLERDLPSFGETAYAHGWVTGALLAPGREPVYVLPRMFVLFHLHGNEPDGLVTVDETADGRALFVQAIASLGDLSTVAVGARTPGETVLELGEALRNARLVNGTPLVNELRRAKSPLELELMKHACLIADGAMAATAPRVEPGVTMAELAEEVEHQLRVRGSRTPSFPTHIFSYGYAQSHDSQLASGLEPLAEGEAVMFDFGAVHAGYCSDFGRTVVCGEPPSEYERANAAMLAAQEAGRAAAVPGALASEVNAACRAPIEEAGFGPCFRHRMGHGIGLDVHEQPFISEEVQTPLEAGMTFTDEPSILWDGHFGVRIEDIVVCAEGGGRILNELPSAL